MQFNVAQREIILKVVYYGPPLSGKTTNLQVLHATLSKRIAGRMTTLNTADDRTLFFDMLPVVMQSQSGYRIKLKLYTVPGQVVHAATRRLVLAGADAVVFVADGQKSEAKLNNEFWHGMRRYLAESGQDAAAVPTVIQFNKCDLPGVRTSEDIQEMRGRTRQRLFQAVAVSGHGVLETLRGALEAMFEDLNQRYDFETKFRVSAEEFLAAVFDTSEESAVTGESGGANS